MLFTDDDDIWSYARVRTYMQSMLEQQNGLDTTVALLSETQADAAFHIGHNIFGPWSIDGMLECNAPGAVVLNMKHASGGEDPSTEHYNYCVRLSALQHFFTSCPGEVLTHKFWDLCLVKYLKHGDCDISLVSPIVDDWMYCHFVNPRTGKDQVALAHGVAYGALLGSITATWQME